MDNSNPDGPDDELSFSSRERLRRNVDRVMSRKHSEDKAVSFYGDEPDEICNMLEVDEDMPVKRHKTSKPPQRPLSYEEMGRKLLERANAKVASASQALQHHQQQVTECTTELAKAELELKAMQDFHSAGERAEERANKPSVASATGRRVNLEG